VTGLAERIAAQSALLGAAFEALLTEIGRPDPAVEARLLFAAVDGMFQHYVLDPAHYPLDAVVTALTAHFGGLSPTEAT
ncbi:MAG: hypothetical protein ACK4YP_13955, partial [Myxococcota bacterium]